jgi:hypothetical protein
MRAPGLVRHLHPAPAEAVNGAPETLPCPWCAARGRFGAAEIHHGTTQGVRYVCAACGVRFTMDKATMASAIVAEAAALAAANGHSGDSGAIPADAPLTLRNRL